MLILKYNGDFLYEVASGGWFALPNGSVGSPAQAGWDSGDGYTIENFDPPAPPPPTMEQKRAVASIPRLNFCLALLRLEILPMAECKAAARGEWPATFAAFVADMNPSDAAEAEIRWAAAQNVEYQHPLLQGLALDRAGGNADKAAELLDAIFGVTP